MSRIKIINHLLKCAAGLLLAAMLAGCNLEEKAASIGSAVSVAGALATVKYQVPVAEQIVAKLELDSEGIAAVDKAKQRLVGALQRFTQLAEPSNYTTSDGRQQLKATLLVNYESELNTTIAAIHEARDVIAAAVATSDAVTDGDKRELRQLWVALQNVRLGAEEVLEKGQVVQDYVNYARLLIDSMLPLLRAVPALARG